MRCREVEGVPVEQNSDYTEGVSFFYRTKFILYDLLSELILYINSPYERIN